MTILDDLTRITLVKEADDDWRLDIFAGSKRVYWARGNKLLTLSDTLRADLERFKDDVKPLEEYYAEQR